MVRASGWWVMVVAAVLLHLSHGSRDGVADEIALEESAAVSTTMLTRGALNSTGLNSSEPLSQTMNSLVAIIAHAEGQQSLIMAHAGRAALGKCIKAYTDTVERCPGHADADIDLISLQHIAQHGTQGGNVSSFSDLEAQMAADAENALEQALQRASFADQFARDTLVENVKGPQNPRDDPDGGLRIPPMEELLMLELEEDSSTEETDASNMTTPSPSVAFCDEVMGVVSDVCQEMRIAAHPPPVPDAAERAQLAQQHEQAFRDQLDADLRTQREDAVANNGTYITNGTIPIWISNRSALTDSWYNGRSAQIRRRRTDAAPDVDVSKYLEQPAPSSFLPSTGYLGGTKADASAAADLDSARSFESSFESSETVGPSE